MLTPKAKAIIKCAQQLGGEHEGFGQHKLEGFRSDSRKVMVGSQMRALFSNDKGEDKADRLYVGGMCHTMSAYWIVHKATSRDRKTFWEWLGPVGHFNQAAANVLVTKTIMYKAQGSMAKDMGILKDKEFDQRFFLGYRLKQSRQVTTFNEVGCTLLGSGPRYTMILFAGKSSGADGAHYCATAASEGRSVYYDPNFGEFRFADMFKAQTFYDQYLDIAGYRKNYTRVRGTIYTFG